MKFRVKITLCMICLLALLFGIGGSALISISFQTTLSREEQSARESCRLLLGTLQVVDNIDLWTNERDVSNTLKRMTTQEVFSSIQLYTEMETLYMQGGAASDFRDLTIKTNDGHSAVAYFTDKQGTPYLQVSSRFQLGQKTLYLNLGRDLSSLYETRALQQKAYYQIFAVMLILCVILAYSISWLLTRPLSSLSKASREIAAGNLSYRSNIQSNDEVGTLSTDFDTMVQQVENSVLNLQDAAKRQEQFMENFAHELKTPMTSIIGYADLLRGQSLSRREEADAANYIFSEGKRLENLSFKLLEIFVENRRVIELKPASPANIIYNLTKYLKPAYDNAGITLSYNCQKGICLLEPDLTHTLLLNLLDNARKALEHGGNIHISTTLLPDGCQFIITDNGNGIPAEAMQHLTEAFYRVDKSRSRSQGSAGLGLTLCAKIVELHHGTIHFASEPGFGTVVTVEMKGGRA